MNIRKTVLYSLPLFMVLAIGLVAFRSNAAEMAQPVDVPVNNLRTEVIVPDNRQVATFAAGCFWCTEAVFQEEPGVDSVVSGYAGGTTEFPTYEAVVKQQTDYREAVQIIYDPEQVNYSRLLDILWRSIDPTDAGGQFVDRGFSYTTAVYFHDEGQQVAAETSLSTLFDSERFKGQTAATKIFPFTTFYQAEAYHQDFYKKSSQRYEAYESASGREDYKARVWEEIQKDLQE